MKYQECILISSLQDSLLFRNDHSLKMILNHISRTKYQILSEYFLNWRKNIIVYFLGNISLQKEFLKVNNKIMKMGISNHEGNIKYYFYMKNSRKAC